MNVFLWVIQSILAFFYLSGGAYKVFAFDEVSKQFAMVPRPAWTTIGIVEMLGAALLIAPAATGWKPQLTPIAAAVLTVQTVAIALVYARYSLALAPTNPLVFAAPMALAAAFVAYGRYSLAPLGG